MRFDRLAEHQIRKAEAEGQLKNLNGAVPEEITLRKAVEQQRAELQQTTDPEQHRSEMRKLSDMQLRLAIQEEARRRFY